MRNVVLVGLVASLATSVLGGPPRLPEPKPDQALVVAIRPGDPGGGDIVADYIFFDETPVAVTKGGTHNLIHHPAGTYMVWCQGGAGIVDLVPEETFFVVCGAFHGFSIVDQEEGEKLFADTKLAPAFTAEVAKRAQKRLPRFHPQFQKLLQERRSVLPAVAELVRPEDASAYLAVPRYSKVTLELMENISSANNTNGEKLLFRVAEAGAVEGHVWLPAGTVVDGYVIESIPAGGGGRPGGVSIDVASLSLPDNPPIPLLGQITLCGQQRGSQSALAFAFGGVLGASAVKGRNSVILVGERVEFWTGGDAWVKAPIAPLQSAEKVVASVHATMMTILEVSMMTEKPPQPPVQVGFDAPSEVKAVRLYEVAGWRVPQEVKATAVRRSEKGWIAEFDRWSLVRHLPVRDTTFPARFQLEMSDGSLAIAEAQVKWKPQTAAQ